MFLFALLVVCLAAHAHVGWLLAALGAFLFGGVVFTNPVLFPTSFAKAASQEKVHDLGGFDVKVLQVSGPTQYPNPAGIPCPASLFGLRSLEWVLPVCNKLGIREYTLDPATGNVHCFVGTTGAEVANGVDISADLVFLLAAGIR